MALEVIERTVFHITDRKLAADVRQALIADDVDILDDMVEFLSVFGGTCRIENSVLTVGEVTDGDLPSAQPRGAALPRKGK
jgi:hypothetical protein